MTLQEIEREVLALHVGITLRPTVEAARRVGDLLANAKATLGHGSFLPWLRRVGIGRRTAQVYMQVAKAQSAAHSDHVSINEFLWIIRAAKRAGRAEERREAREEALKTEPAADERYRVHHADCRLFEWPEVDLIATDPPWGEKDNYRWLASFAARHLRKGGLCLAQCGTPDLLEVLTIMTEGLEYVTTLALVYDEPFGSKGLPFNSAWRPIVAVSNGPWERKGLRSVTDTITTRNGHYVKTLHPWQQPCRPWAYWIEALSRPGERVADPYSGSGTSGVATKAAGARWFVGTELDAEHAQVAQRRINDTEEGKNLA